MNETENIRADQLGRGQQIKHPQSGEWVTVKDVRPAGQGENPPVLDAATGAPKTEWNRVEVQLDTDEWLPLFRPEDQVTRRVV